MIHYHLYINSGLTVRADDCFYKVAIGSTTQATRDYLFLTAYAVEHGHFFELVTPESNAFLMRIRESLNLEVLPLRFIKARDLVRAIKAQQRMPLDPCQLHNQHAHLKRSSEPYFLTTNTALPRFPSANAGHVKKPK